MEIQSIITDNVSELIVTIIKFTQKRHQVLCENLNNIHTQGFVPKDLPVSEFSDVMNLAVAEHVCKERLVLRDTENIKFVSGGNFKVKTIADRYARELLENDPSQYLEFQINKLSENSINQKVAKELFRQKEGISLFPK